MYRKKVLSRCLRMKSKFTIHDLAADLAISPGTVSKVLNGKGHVTDATRHRILDRAKEVGYVASHSARILKAKHSWTIGVVFSDIALFGLEHPFFGSIIQAFKNTIEEHGYEMVFIPKKLGQQQQTYLQWARNKNVDGVLILTGDKNDKDILELIRSDILCVSTDIVMDGLTTIVSDDQQGIHLMLDHLLAQRHRDIAAMSGSLFSRAYQQRADAFRTILDSKGLVWDDTRLCVSEAYGYDAYYATAKQWIQTWTTRPTAILAFSDDIAMALIHALRDEGLDVPHDIIVSGYDDIHFARLFSPSITTIRQNKHGIAKLAAEKLLMMIQGTYVDPMCYKVSVELIERQSTKRFE